MLVLLFQPILDEPGFLWTFGPFGIRSLFGIGIGVWAGAAAGVEISIWVWAGAGAGVGAGAGAEAGVESTVQAANVAHFARCFG